MTIRCNVTGAERKRLVKTIADSLGAKPEYLGMPSAAYMIDGIMVTKNGTLMFDNMYDSEEIETMLEAVGNAGFNPVGETTAVSVGLPFDTNDRTALENVYDLVASKHNLIAKALGSDRLPVETKDGALEFEWFNDGMDPDELKAWTDFICKLCALAKTLRRVNKTEKDEPNEKYAFRCFLLRLGFIGDEYKAARKILLKNLEGSAAFKNGGKSDD